MGLAGHRVAGAEPGLWDGIDILLHTAWEPSTIGHNPAQVKQGGGAMRGVGQPGHRALYQRLGSLVPLASLDT